MLESGENPGSGAIWLEISKEDFNGEGKKNHPGRGMDICNFKEA